jgi:hypothetical protein
MVANRKKVGLGLGAKENVARMRAVSPHAFHCM